MHTTSPEIAVAGPQPDYPLLDLIRGGAALLVLISHVRAFVMADYVSLVSPHIFQTIFYLLTSFGHESVMIFFVLSGFVVTMSVERQVNADSWHLGRYASDRISRLWTVLIPVLLFTAIIDILTYQLTGSTFYLGYLTYFNSGTLGPADWSILTFLGNVIFLQGIATPVFGSNTPLWSLACEFWYYALLPLITLPFLKKHLGRAVLVASAGAAGVVGLGVGSACLTYFPIWMMGCIALWIGDASRRKRSWMLAIFVTATLGGAGLASISGQSDFASDLCLGLVVACAISLAGRRTRLSQALERIGSHLSKISYSLYLVHFPVLASLSALLLKNERFSDARGFLFFIVFSIVAVAVSTAVYFLFERQTGLVRTLLRTVLVPTTARQ